MSSENLMGVNLELFQDPIIEAFARYQETSDGLVIDGASAGKLVLTPDKPNSARTATKVSFRGVGVGTLYTIAFKPGDGTGDESSYKLSELDISEPYPSKTLVVPRKKFGVYEEHHLTVVTYKIENVHAEPTIFNGVFDLLGLEGNKVVKIGQLGITKAHKLQPTSTLTVGYHNSKRFGDPHAVYNNRPDMIQVCAFLAISDEVQKQHPNILKDLNPQLPFKVSN